MDCDLTEAATASSLVQPALRAARAPRGGWLALLISCAACMPRLHMPPHARPTHVGAKRVKGSISVDLRSAPMPSTTDTMTSHADTR